VGYTPRFEKKRLEDIEKKATESPKERKRPQEARKRASRRVDGLGRTVGRARRFATIMQVFS